MGRVVDLLVEALVRGAFVDWSDPGKPTIKAVPLAHAAQLRWEREALREILRRAGVFRRQAEEFIRHGRTLPILGLPEHEGDDGCLSCGAPIDPARFRCRVCAVAVNLALAGGQGVERSD